MGLIFPRLANNFARNGYFPTDEATLERILQALAPSGEGPMRILDPCCGEGLALAECKHHLGAERCEAHGVEYHEARAYHAKTLLDTCIHGDLFLTAARPAQYGLLFLNPPYGDAVGDQAAVSARSGTGRQRLEKRFYQRTRGLLQAGGVMVFILPHYSLDAELAGWIARHFERVRVFRAMTDAFRQVVVLGIRRHRSQAGQKAIRTALEAAGQGEPVPQLPERWEEAPYAVPTTPVTEPQFRYTALDARQLAEALTEGPTLWGHFATHFAAGATVHRRPLTAMRPWHLALGLAAGQVGGAVEAADGRVFVVKGHTRKVQDREVTTDDEGNETHVLTDRFVPAISAWNFTPGERFGELVRIA
ncbi:DUF6094 domain-containing protein [Endothiovibrio diazotrophicus]